MIYGRKDGMALTLDVIRPTKNPNGAAAMMISSGGWFSAHNFTPDTLLPFTQEILNRGYTIFVVVHGSQPRYTIPDAVLDVRRAVRFVRFNAKRWKIDPNKIGVFGGSAGGHLSLMTGLASDKGDEKAADPVDKVSSRVQAVCAWFPPTDFVNYGEPGKDAVKTVLAAFRAAFDFRELNPKTNRYVQITDEKKIHDMEVLVSPITYVSEDDPPVLVIHGDADTLVPIQQARVLMQKLEEKHVIHELIVRPGMGHGWPKLKDDTIVMTDWFDRHLRKKTSTKPAGSQSGKAGAGSSSAPTAPASH